MTDNYRGAKGAVHRTGQDSKLEYTRGTGGPPLPAQVYHDEDALTTFIDEHLDDSPDSDAWKGLRAANVVAQTCKILSGMNIDIQQRLTDQKRKRARVQADCWRRGPRGSADWFDFDAKDKKWRARTMDRKRMIEAHIGLANRARKDANQAVWKEQEQMERVHLRRAVVSLAQMVQKHHDRTDPAVARQQDQTLWAALDLLMIPHGGELISLTEALDIDRTFGWREAT